MTTEPKLTRCLFGWDEPEGCASPRGWLGLLNHPDIPPSETSGYLSRCVGNYLDYESPGPHGSRGPNGETVHATAYIFRNCPPCHVQENIGLGYGWFFTIQEAKDFIENNVRAYFGIAPKQEIQKELAFS